ncbi:GntR family transcriptional regulator [uncultured Enterovirga sp.]|uniref:GntR family transcriptional regulator n=1 Tax=uncultured Enterovirga sp. TaxID=2026352 RepID=UPI0035CA33B4
MTAVGSPEPDANRLAPPHGRRKGELHANAVTALREMIVSGALAPGARLKEVELGAALGVSRTPLREALKVLASEGLVALLPNRSAVVSGLDLADSEALFEVVAALEALAGRLACGRMTAEEIERVETLNGTLSAHHARGDLGAYFEANQEIHWAIVRASRNAVLIETWERLRHRVRRARFLSNVVRRTRWPEAVREHATILNVLKARDGDRLAELMHTHILAGLEAIRSGKGTPSVETNDKQGGEP